MTATASPAATGARLPRGAVVALAVGVALLLAAYLGGRPGRDGPPLDPRSDGPLGTSALVALLRELGASVELSSGLPGPADDVALLLQDRLDAGQADRVRDWVEAGGTLVVTDPGSAFAPPLAGGSISAAPVTVRPGACSIDALAGLDEVAAGAAARYAVAGGADACFSEGGDEAYVVRRDLGAGQVVAVGGAAAVTNDLLDEEDNAVLAATVLAPSPTTSVRFVDAPLPAGGGDKTLGDLVSDGVRRGLLQAAAAFVLYALWRAIRLGRPVPEPQPIDVAGSELVAAIGRLLSQTREPGAVAEVLRDRARRALRSRFGLPAATPPAVLAEVTASRTSAEAADVLAAVDDRPVTTDAELVAVARAVASIHQEVLR